VCQEKNLASRKCIENNGGVFEKTHDAQCHYWITFGDTGTAAVRQ
jgi:predicted acetyltransferase